MRKTISLIVLGLFFIGSYSYATNDNQGNKKINNSPEEKVVIWCSGAPTEVPVDVKGSGNFPVWEYAPAAGITTYIFIKTANDSDTFYIYLYGSDGTTVGSTIVSLNANQSTLIDVSTILESEKLAALTDDNAKAGYYLGNGSVYSLASTQIVIFVDVYFAASNSGFSVPFYQ